MLPIVSSSPSDNIIDFIKSDELYLFNLDDNACCIKSLSISNTIRHEPKDKTLYLLLVHGFHFIKTIDYIGRDVCLFKRKFPHAEPLMTRETAQRHVMLEFLPPYVSEVVAYQEGPLTALTVPRLFPAGFGSTNPLPLVERLLAQGFVTGKKVDTPLGCYWTYSRAVAYVPAVPAQALPMPLPLSSPPLPAEPGGAGEGGGERH